jgi:hypothetical protein
MLNKRVGSLALVLFAAVGLYACGSDDDTTVAAGGAGGTSGSAGKGSGGSAGKGSGGSAGNGATAGTAGKAEAGAAGMSGGATGDEGGMGGAAPLPTGGAAGEAAGGTGATGATGAMGGEGGAAGGGAVAMTLAQACAIVCADQTGLSCTLGTQCMDTCVVNETMSPAPPKEYDAMIECQAAVLTSATYECSDQGGGLIWPAAKDGTTCEQAICTWTCDDGGTLADVNIFTRCGC